jgi:hypothetical protein
VRVRLEVAMRKQGEKREREETVKRKQEGEAARERRGGVKRRSRLIFFFFAWLLSLVASTSSNPAFFETLDPLSTFPPSLFSSTMIAARTRPTMCMASAAKPAPSKVLQRASREQKGLERGGQSFGSMRLALLSFSLSLSTRGRRGREASPKKLKTRPSLPVELCLLRCLVLVTLGPQHGRERVAIADALREACRAEERPRAGT